MPRLGAAGLVRSLVVSATFASAFATVLPARAQIETVTVTAER